MTVRQCRNLVSAVLHELIVAIEAFRLKFRKRPLVIFKMQQREYEIIVVRAQHNFSTGLSEPSLFMLDDIIFFDAL